MKRKYLKREEKHALLREKITAFQKHWYDNFRGNLQGVTVSQVARLAGYANSTRLRETLYDMVDNGDLVMVVKGHYGVAETVCIFYAPEYAPERLV